MAFGPERRRPPAMRSCRALWLWLGGLFLTLAAFLAAVAIAYFEKETHYALLLNWWMLAACVSFLTAFTCFLGAIEGWRFPPWMRPAFPHLKVEIYGTGSIDTEREAATGLAVPARLRTCHARCVHTEAEPNA